MSVWRLKSGVSIVETVGSPAYHFTASESTITRKFIGRMTTLLANKPKIGASMQGIDKAFTVDDLTIAPEGGGGKGLMTVMLKGPEQDKHDKSDPSTYELEWTEVEKPIETHPRFASIAENYMALVQAYFATTDTAERADIYSRINDTEAKLLITKKLKGIESYVVYVPVSRRTTALTTPSFTGSCGQIETPGSSVPSGYQWMKSAHRLTRTGRSGKWQKAEEWTGVKSYDRDLYPVPTGWGM